MRVIILAPSSKRLSETFIRANLIGLPFEITAYFGDAFGPLFSLAQNLYCLSTLFAKILYHFGFFKLGTFVHSLIVLFLVRVNKPDCIIAEFGFHAVLVMEIASFTDIPVIVHFRGADLSAKRYIERFRRRYQRLLYLAGAVIVKSKIMHQRILSLTASLPKSLPILISPSGANSDIFNLSNPLVSPPHFLSVGRFVEKKGPLLTIKAFKKALDHKPDMHLFMIGEGPLFPECKVWIEKNKLRDRIHLLGAKSQILVASYMQGVRGFLQHSLRASDGDEEGCPVSILEAQYSGIPVVSTYHAGIPEVVEHGVTGFLVNEGDIEAMAQRILSLAKDTSLAAKLGKKAHLKCKENFTINQHLKSITNLVNKLVKERESNQSL